MRSLERLLIALFVFLASVQTLPLDLVQYSVLMQVFDDLCENRRSRLHGSHHGLFAACKNCMRFASSDECDGPEVVCKGGFVLHLCVSPQRPGGSRHLTRAFVVPRNLTNMQLFGSIPSSLGQLTGLTYL